MSLELYLPDSRVRELHERIMREFDFETTKPIVFLPCSRTKPYSRSKSHCYMSAITRDERIIKIVISDLCGPIPYAYEDQVPEYDIHPNWINRQLRDSTVKMVREFLRRLKASKIYYLGQQYHAWVLRDANIGIGKEIAEMIPARGIIDYARFARELKRRIFKEG